MIAYFDRLEIAMTLKQAQSISPMGVDASNDITNLLKDKKIRKQMDKLDEGKVRLELKETGAWDASELKDKEDKPGY
jgi:hypothetical protein